LGGAIAHFEGLIQEAVNAVPECASREAMRALVRQESERLVPREACDKYRHTPKTHSSLTA
jgi:geranylgeranyl diphosphate synthase type II